MKRPDFSDVKSQREWHSQWPRWINTLLAYQYVSHTAAQSTAEGAAALEMALRWLRRRTSNQEVTAAMKAAFAVSPVRSLSSPSGDKSAQLAACVAACAINRHPETVMVYAIMCITESDPCVKLAAELIELLGPLTGPDDQLVAMDRLEELGVLPPMDH